VVWWTEEDFEILSTTRQTSLSLILNVLRKARESSCNGAQIITEGLNLIFVRITLQFILHVGVIQAV